MCHLDLTGQPYNPNINPYQPTGVVPTPYMPYKPATGAGLLGASAQGAPETENRRYVNKETGQVRMIPFNKATGQSLYPIPEGFVFEPEAPKEEAKTTKVQTAKVKTTDTSSGDDAPTSTDTIVSLGGQIDPITGRVTKSKSFAFSVTPPPDMGINAFTMGKMAIAGFTGN